MKSYDRTPTASVRENRHSEIPLMSRPREQSLEGESEVADINSDSGFFCNLGAMTSEERTVYGALSRKLFGAVEEKRDLDNGYAYRLAALKVSISEVAQWVTFERRCCPFFNLQIEVERNDGPVWLRMTGPAGVKEFIKAETGG